MVWFCRVPSCVFALALLQVWPLLGYTRVRGCIFQDRRPQLCGRRYHRWLEGRHEANPPPYEPQPSAAPPQHPPSSSNPPFPSPAPPPSPLRRASKPYLLPPPWSLCRLRNAFPICTHQPILHHLRLTISHIGAKGHHHPRHGVDLPPYITTMSYGEKVLKGIAELAQLAQFGFLRTGLTRTWHGYATAHAVWELPICSF